MPNDKVLLKVKEGIATLTLNRPEVHNALDSEMILSLSEYLNKLQEDNQIQALVLQGNGANFCSGADIQWMKKSAEFSREENFKEALTLARLLYTLYYFNKPTIVLVQGKVFGGALGLIASADIAIAEESSTFCFSEVKLGLTPAVISPYIMRAMGERITKRYMMTAEVFTAKEAKNYGLIHDLSNRDVGDLNVRLKYFLDKLLQNGSEALKATKKLCHHLLDHPISLSLMEYTANLMAEIRSTDEAKEGLNAFLEKRVPRWLSEKV